MKTWRVVVRIIGAVSGALITAILGGLRYLWDRWPLSMLEWIAVIAITLSILYGLAELVHFLFGLNRRTQTVNAWLGIHPTTIHYGRFGSGCGIRVSTVFSTWSGARSTTAW